MSSFSIKHSCLHEYFTVRCSWRDHAVLTIGGGLLHLNLGDLRIGEPVGCGEEYHPMPLGELSDEEYRLGEHPLRSSR